ncbi:DNA polymerase I [Cutibacterium acnes JCM 18918]|nr:DNA polymerase I [Cutibacterium acnes JCM 18918]
MCHLDRIPLSVASSKVNDMSETTQPILMVLDGHSMAFRAFLRPAGRELHHLDGAAH